MDKVALEVAVSRYNIWLYVFTAIGILTSVGILCMNVLKNRASGQLSAIAKEERVADQNLALDERRRLADTRWQLERIQRGVLPREISAQKLQAILEKVQQIPQLGPVNVLTLDDNAAEPITLQMIEVLKAAGVLGKVLVAPAGTRLRSEAVYRPNPSGEQLARILWETTGTFFGASLGIRAIGMETLPEHENALIIGTNMIQPGNGQPGEGLDAHGNPIPRP